MAADFRKTDGTWETKIVLDDWSSFFDYPVEVDVRLGGDEEVEMVQDKHLQTFEYLKDNQKQILKNILEKIFSEYKNLQEIYNYDEEDKCMPDIDSTAELKDLIDLLRVYILNVEKNNLCYIGFEFACKWDDEHGLGFMTHGTKVVEMDDASCSFVSWIAEKDCKNEG